jgi:hypothetical protein
VFTFWVNNWASPSLVEHFYLNKVYQWIRLAYQATAAHLPFAFVYILLPFMVYVIWRGIKLVKENIKSKSYLNVLNVILFSLLVIYNLFYFSWAFNYKTRNVSARLGLSSVQLDTLLILRELTTINEALTQIRIKLCSDTIAMPIELRPIDVESQIRKAQQKILTGWGFIADKTIRVRPLYPKGTLLIWSTAGIYNPFSFEGHYDAGMYHLQSTYVIAHEMAHGYGITNEADCNFIALLTCLETDDDYIMYSGLLTYWRYLMNDLKEKARYSFYQSAYHRPIGVRRDIKALYAYLDKYPDILPHVRDIIYDTYLKSNGVNDGLKSYNKVIDLVFAYRLQKGRSIHFTK